MTLWNQVAASKLVPLPFQGGLRRWIENRIEPGSFLMAVIENDLRGAIGYAAPESLEALPGIVQFLYNYSPCYCWGSKARAAEWGSGRFNETPAEYITKETK